MPASPHLPTDDKPDSRIGDAGSSVRRLYRDAFPLLCHHCFIALYQNWVPFLLSLGLVTLHHGLIGTLAPTRVYNHPEAILHPWIWAGIHAGAVLAESVSILIYWRLHETDALDLRLLRLNKASDESLGCPRNELIEKNDHDLFPKQEADLFTTKDRDVLAANRLLDIPEKPFQTKTKGIRLLHTKKIPICGTDGVPQGCATLRDGSTCAGIPTGPGSSGGRRC